ncbi:hypothetical protein B0T16DRAFT_459115 [Cercophora newfieldiana]|uniref:Uncharacterized protein n=1 Tax=Cercophora newfieldiana TaxID=92897 RepID=A0AA39Y109_9PEZI|nr:hypothetical protein B0T16DRAFT_459115 [Cercophora newfieldiana]
MSKNLDLHPVLPAWGKDIERIFANANKQTEDEFHKLHKAVSDDNAKQQDEVRKLDKQLDEIKRAINDIYIKITTNNQRLAHLERQRVKAMEHNKSERDSLLAWLHNGPPTLSVSPAPPAPPSHQQTLASPISQHSQAGDLDADGHADDDADPRFLLGPNGINLNDFISPTPEDDGSAPTRGGEPQSELNIAESELNETYLRQLAAGGLDHAQSGSSSTLGKRPRGATNDGDGDDTQDLDGYYSSSQRSKRSRASGSTYANEKVISFEEVYGDGNPRLRYAIVAGEIDYGVDWFIVRCDECPGGYLFNDLKPIKPASRHLRELHTHIHLDSAAEQ